MEPPPIPEALGWWRAEPGGAAWLDELPRLIADCRERWQLRLGEPFDDARIGYVVRATRLDGTPVVLKINKPEPDGEHEASALRHWAGDGAVRLIDDDPARWALLLERLVPGDRLWDLADEIAANEIAASVLRRLHAQATPAADAPFRPLAVAAAAWAAELPRDWERFGRPFERRLLDEALDLLRDLPRTPVPSVLLHQDFHGGNVLRDATRGWLAIDPKPLVGDPAFDAASLLRDRRSALASDPAPARRVRRRLDQLAELLDLDRERMRSWGIAHAIGWASESDGFNMAMIATGRWLSEA